MPHLVKLCVLGSCGVGKTSLVEQFIYNNFDGNHRPTKLSGDTYNFSIISSSINSNLCHIKIIDMPMISYFPTNSFYEWTDYRRCALRTAHAYIIVFDLTSPGSFHYVKGTINTLTLCTYTSNTL
jgi:Ras-like protein family protein 10B